MALFIGIDNGLNGAIVAIDDLQRIVYKGTIPILKLGKKKEYDIRAITYILDNIPDAHARVQGTQVHAVVEKALIIPVSGRLSLFSTGFCNGMMQGILSALGISYEVVAPKEWQKEVLKGMNTKDTKQASIMWCKRKYPEEDFTATERSTKDHDGICDALCMATYCLRMNR